MRRNDTATIWAPLAEIRINDRALRSLSAATVEQYRGWLEDGREAPPIRIARVGDAFVVRDGRTASQPRWRRATASSKRRCGP